MRWSFFFLAFSSCVSIPNLPPHEARCDALADQYRTYGAVALFSTALGAAAIAPAAVPGDPETRAAFAISSATLAALGVALELVADDLETEWVSACEAEDPARVDHAGSSTISE